jgi:ribosomal protein S18 acetylase RimI-like enzyme
VSDEVRALDLDDKETLKALIALQRASYRVEADLLGVETLPALTESGEQLCASGEAFLGAYDGPRLVGAVSWRREGGLLDIHRLVVHPDAFRRGVATRLLDALDESQAGATRTIVATGAANDPARRLYERRGFEPYDERLAPGGVPVVTYERRRKA